MRVILQRFIFFYIDSLMFSIVSIVLYIIHRTILNDLEIRLENFRSFELMPYFFYTYFLYFLLAEYFFGTTLGKKIFKFKIEGEHKFLKFFLRTLIRFIPLEPISFILNEDNIFWHEKWSGIYTRKIK